MAEEFDVVVIGSGPGGYVAAIKAAQLGLSVACIEKYPAFGGTCLNVGCIPSKALLHATEMFHKIKHKGKELGILAKELSYDFPLMMENKAKVVSSFNLGISSLFKKNKVTSFTGVASFVDPYTVEVEGKQIKGKNFILATGSKPTPLPFLPFDEKKILSSTGALSLQKPPKKMLVIGAGIIGVELGSVYARLGTEVVFLEFLDRICPTLDVEVSQSFQKLLEAQGLTFHLQSKVTKGKAFDKGVQIFAEVNGKEEEFTADCVLVAVGRRPYSEGLSLEKIGIEQDKRGFVTIDSSFRTNLSHIYAIGDLVDGPSLAHKAEEEGIAVAEILSGQSPKIEYMAIPSVVYTDPEVAAVGLTEKEAKEKNLTITVVKFPFKANSRARAIHESDGFVKLIIHKETSLLLGMHILGPHAGELIMEGVLAITHKLTVQKLAHSCHAHPTLSEAIKEAALMGFSKAIHI